MVCFEVFEVYTEVLLKIQWGPPLTVEEAAQLGLWRKLFDHLGGGVISFSNGLAKFA